jgi:hypothetical protein
MPKSRGFTYCECCKALVSSGQYYAVFHGRPWLPDHLKKYQERRLALKA